MSDKAKLDEATARLELARGAVTRAISANPSAEDAKALKFLYDAVKLILEAVTEIEKRRP
jgi:hypothetical protein